MIPDTLLSEMPLLGSGELQIEPARGETEEEDDHPIDRWSTQRNIEVGPSHRLIIATCSLGVAAEAAEIMCMGYVLPLIDFKDSVAMRSHLSAAVFLGMLVGGLIFGILSDSIGRKPCLQIAMAVNATFGVLSAVAPSSSLLILCRMFAGMGVGGSVPVVFAMARESLPAKSRGFYLVLVASGWMCGSVVTASMAWLILSPHALNGSWQVFVAFCAIPSAVCFVFASSCIGESPRFLYEAQKYDELEIVLGRWVSEGGVASAETEGGGGEPLVDQVRALEREGGDGPDSIDSDASCANGGVSAASAASAASTRGGAASTYALFGSPDLRARMVCMLLGWFGLSFGWYGLVLWMPSLFAAQGLAMSMYEDALLVALANLPGNVVSAWLIDRPEVGRKGLCVASMAGAAGCAFLLAVSCSQGNVEVEQEVMLQEAEEGVIGTIATIATPTSSDAAAAPSSQSRSSAVLLVLLSCCFNAFATAAWNAVDVLSVEAFPTNTRTTAMGWCAACGRLGSLGAQYFNGYCLDPSRMKVRAAVGACRSGGCAAVGAWGSGGCTAVGE
jgi:MFS family permease